MSEPFLGEVRMMSFGFAPRGWVQCNGAMMPINQNQALFSLLGTAFGGNGQTTFGLPDLRGRAPIYNLNGIGTSGGEEAHTLTMGEMPQHTHIMQASNQPGDGLVPSVLAATNNAYGPGSQNPTNLNPTGVSNVGGSQPHNNMQPYSVLNFCIAIQGIFPSRN